MTFKELALEIQRERIGSTSEQNDIQDKSELIKAGKRYIKSKLEIVFLTTPQIEKNIIFHLDECEELAPEDDDVFNDFFDNDSETADEEKEIFGLSELERIFAPHEYTEEQRENLEKNKNELIQIVSMFWYAIYLHYFKAKDEQQEKEKQIFSFCKNPF